MPRKLAQIGQAYTTEGKAVSRTQGGSVELLESVRVALRMYREVGGAQRWFSLAFNQNDQLVEVEVFVPMEALQGQGDRSSPLKAAVYVD